MDGIRKFLGAFFLFFLCCLFLPGLEDGAALLLEDAALSAYANQRRRTFLPNEVTTIYQHLGHP